MHLVCTINTTPQSDAKVKTTAKMRGNPASGSFCTGSAPDNLAACCARDGPADLLTAKLNSSDKLKASLELVFTKRIQPEELGLKSPFLTKVAHLVPQLIGGTSYPPGVIDVTHIFDRSVRAERTKADLRAKSWPGSEVCYFIFYYRKESFWRFL